MINLTATSARPFDWGKYAEDIYHGHSQLVWPCTSGCKLVGESHRVPICDAVRLILPKVCGAIVYPRQSEGEDFTSSVGPMPKEGPSWDTVQKKKLNILKDIHLEHPTLSQIQRQTRSGTCTVVYAPVVDQTVDSVTALIVGPYDDYHEETLLVIDRSFNRSR